MLYLCDSYLYSVRGQMTVIDPTVYCILILRINDNDNDNDNDNLKLIVRRGIFII